MNRSSFLLIPLLFGLLLPTAASAARSRLQTESYIEDSEVDFPIAVKDVTPPGKTAALRVFELSGPSSGEHTMLVFVDGHFFRRQPVRLPGRYPFSLRGLAPGDHAITLQVIDASGRVASSRVKVRATDPSKAPQE